MKKMLVILLCFMVIFTTACSKVETNKPKIVTTIFPIYEWVKNALGSDNSYEVVYLIDKGVDLHNYSPTAEEVQTILESELFIFLGGESDEWAKKLIDSNPDVKHLSIIGKLQEMNVAFIDPHDHDHDHDHDHSHDHDHNHSHDHSDHVDEHIWNSIPYSVLSFSIVKDKIISLKPEIEQKESKKHNEYIQKMMDLYNDFEEFANSLPEDEKTIIIADRNPFKYLAQDFGITIIAAFDGCSAETQVSFDTMVELIESVNRFRPSVVFKTEDAGHRIAEQVVEKSENPATKVVTLNSMQSVTKEDVEKGVTYLEIMKSNFEALKTALSK